MTASTIMLHMMILAIVAFVVLGFILLYRALRVLEEEVSILDTELNKLEEKLLDKNVVSVNEVIAIKE